MRTLSIPDAITLRSLLDYSPDDGGLVWRQRSREMFDSCGAFRSWNTKFSGKPAFRTVNSYGYLTGKLSGKRYYAHRIIWVLVTGNQPEEVDHINGNKTDNRIENLRSVTRTQNMRNRPISKNNTSGVVGVSWSKSDKKWSAHIRINGRQIHIGRFCRKDAAIAARKAKEEALKFHKNHGRIVA